MLTYVDALRHPHESFPQPPMSHCMCSLRPRLAAEGRTHVLGWAAVTRRDPYPMCTTARHSMYIHGRTMGVACRGVACGTYSVAVRVASIQRIYVYIYRWVGLVWTTRRRLYLARCGRGQTARRRGAPSCASASRSALVSGRARTNRALSMHWPLRAAAGIFSAYIYSGRYIFSATGSLILTQQILACTCDKKIYWPVLIGTLYCTCSCVYPYRERSVYCEMV
jgi:hypothetical protein